jgi:hypothetical protein
MDKEQLLKRLDKAWMELNESFAGLPESRMMQPGVTGNWSVKDLLAHITTWEEEALKHLPEVLKGIKPPLYSVTYGGIHAFNQKMTEQKSSLSVADVLRQFEATHRRLITYIKEASDDQFTRETRFRRRIRLDTYSHYPKHAKAIRDWRARA